MRFSMELCRTRERRCSGPDDLGVLRGEGVFETTLVVDGEPRDLDDHLARLAVSGEMTGLWCRLRIVGAAELTHWCRRGQ